MRKSSTPDEIPKSFTHAVVFVTPTAGKMILPTSDERRAIAGIDTKNGVENSVSQAGHAPTPRIA